MGAPQYEQAGADVAGSGTTNTIPRWTGPTTLGDSVITQSGAVGLEAITISRASATNNPLVVLSTPSGTSQQLFLRGGTAVEYFDFFRSNATGALHVQGSQAGFNNICLAPTSGNVGIGTASPGALLDVNTGAAAGSYVTSTRLSQTGTAANSGQRILFYNSAQAWEQGAIGSLREGANNNFALTFLTSSAGANTERARIDSNGNFGLGTSNPQNYANYKFITTDGTSGSGFQLRANTTSTAEFYVTAADVQLKSVGAVPLIVSTNNIERMRADASGNVVVNTAAIATNATNGFLYVPSCAGTPTGTPTTYTGRVPIVVDTTNNKLYFYSGGSWRDAGP